MSKRPVIQNFDLRKAALKRAFSDLFPEHAELFQKYKDKPGCGICWRNLYAALAQEQDRMRRFFGDVEFDLYTGEALVPQGSMSSSTRSWSCAVIDLQARIGEEWERNVGSRQIAIARWSDQITVIMNVIDVGESGQGSPIVINCTDVDLQDQLDRLDKSHPGPKLFASSRWEDQLTLVVVPVI